MRTSQASIAQSSIFMSLENLEIALAHWTSSLCHDQARNVVDAFSAALGSLLQCASPATVTAREINLLGSGQQQQLWAWNASMPSRVDECIHNLISLCCI
jgi:predicted Zn-dependent protease